MNAEKYILGTSKFIIVAACLLPLLLKAENTPANLELKDDSIVRIECDYTGKDDNIEVFKNPKTNSETPADNTKKTGFHYDLYIPEGYNTDPKASYPCMFIASPGGNANMGKMAKRLKQDRWVVVMLVESKNDDNTWAVNFLAAHDDVVKRMRIAGGAKFATGLSGGSRCCSTYPLLRSGFSGIVCQSAGFAYKNTSSAGIIDFYAKYPRQVAVAGTFGSKDFNLMESYTIWTILPAGSRKWIEIFEGGHEWCSADTFGRAMDWMEERVFVDKPVKPESSNFLLKGGTGVEPPGKNAYLWYFEVVKRRAASADSKYEKYLLLLRRNTVAANGGLAAVPSVKTEMASISTDISQLKTDLEVQKEALAKVDYDAIQKIYASIDDEMPRGQHEFNKRILSSKEKKLFDDYYKACDKFLAKYPNSFYSKGLSSRKTALNIEFK
ncbi:MAG TPA: hypothetical protein DET40_13600 [Lentisphaeria bacterium]|nr:MAG: hypothetical protein A2X45_01595 [Lentisphaerae bacterium GWF2_50_93]HCE44575.1 hypothetical protein [Lentisphaeria bacterium]